MNRITREEHTPGPVAISQKKVLTPFAAIEHLVADRCFDSLLEATFHILVQLHGGVERPVPFGVLHDQKTRPFVRNQVVPTSPGPFAQWDTIIEFVAAIKSLAKSSQVGFAPEAYAKLYPHQTRPAVAADEIVSPYPCRSAVRRAECRYDAWSLLLELHEFGAVSNGHGRNSLGGALENGLQSILEDELVRFERSGTIVGQPNLLSCHVD